MQPKTICRFAGVLFTLCLTACGTTQVSRKESLWADQHFSQSSIKLPGASDLFELPPELEQKIRAAHIINAPIQDRANYLLKLIYSDDNRPFLYEGYHSTVASETWRKNKGDCLSLSILAYAIGKRINLPIAIQEVPMPVFFDRHGNVEFLNAHVNTIILSPNLSFNQSGHSSEQGFMLIDFDPDQFTQRRGNVLSEAEVLSHYYNNLGVEAMLKDQKDLAYAYFKSAIQQFPKHIPSYTNLALLYKKNHLGSNAIEVLETALSVDKRALLALRQLQSQYSLMGRDQEAQMIQRRLESIQDGDPYYWIGRGLFELGKKNYARAIQDLERAQKFANGFEEIHQALATAYWQNGEVDKAKQQLELLTQINRENPKLRYLRERIAAN